MSSIKRFLIISAQIEVFDNATHKGQQLLDNFDYIFRTADFGLTKRDARLYSIIESKLGVDANQIIHIGDAYYDDYIYPQKYGINTILYNNQRYNERCKSRIEVYGKIKAIVKKLNK